MKNVLITYLFFLIGCITTACTKEKIVEREKIVSAQVRTLTNAENRAEINRRRLAMNLPAYPQFLVSWSFFSDYPQVARVGDIFYNNDGFNEALVLKVENNRFLTFEGMRDSSRLFYRRLKADANGTLLMMPCDSDEVVNDSADVYTYHKF